MNAWNNDLFHGIAKHLVYSSTLLKMLQVSKYWILFSVFCCFKMTFPEIKKLERATFILHWRLSQQQQQRQRQQQQRQRQQQQQQQRQVLECKWEREREREAGQTLDSVVTF